MGIRDRPTSFLSPWQNCFAERLVESIGRECTDHLIVFNAEHLRQILAKYTTYYNEVRTHVSLGNRSICRSRTCVASGLGLDLPPPHRVGGVAFGGLSGSCATLRCGARTCRH